jgi:hypothetical protein
MANKARRINKSIAGGAGVMAATVPIRGGLCAKASDPLLDVLIRKGILTEQEAKEVQAETRTDPGTSRNDRPFNQNGINNLFDSDFFEGRASLEGILASVSCNFADAISGAVCYGYARRINHALGTGGNSPDLPVLNPIGHYIFCNWT